MLAIKKMFVMIILASALFSPNVVAHAGETVSQRTLLKAVNSIRAQYNLPGLALHPALQKAAREQSVLMARAGKMTHKVGWRHSFSARLKRVGYRGIAAENIARGQKSLQRVLRGWMNSPGHRRNMLHPRMRYFGLDVVKGGGRNYWAMILGG